MDAGSLDLIGEVFPGISIIDDPLKSGDSQAEIEALEPYYIDEFSTRRTGNWRQALIATRFSIDDLHAIVMNLDGLYDSNINPTGWLYLNLQALCKNPSEDLLLRKLNESLWETHPTLNSTELLKLERKNEYRFNTVYQGNPSVSTGNIVNSAVIHNPSEELLFGNLILAVDCANSSSDTSDYSAVTVAGFGTDKSIVIVDQIVGKFSVQELRVEIEKLFNTYVINEICFENSALGLVLIPEYETNFANCNPTNIKVTKLSVQLYGNKVRRLQYIAHEFANTFFTNTWLESYTQLRAELLAFPYGKNDDRVDSLIWALIRLSQLRPLTDEADLFGYGLGDNFTDVYTYNPEIELYT
jgi:phage terminase large subunit-like protein